MYEIYETFGTDLNKLSYYTIRILYNRSLDKRKNLPFRIYDDLQQPKFDNVVSGNKSIVYDYVRIVLEEFRLSDPSDEMLWDLIVITDAVLKKKCNCLTQVALDETFKEVEKYLKKKGIGYQRLKKRKIFGNSPSRVRKELTDE